MSQKCIKRIILLLAISLSFNCYSQHGLFQEEGAFIRHLRLQRLYDERLFALKQLSFTNHETLLEKAWTFHALGSYDSAINTYDKVPLDSVFKFGFRTDYLNVLFKYNYAEQVSKIENIISLHDQDTTLQTFKTNIDALKLRYSLEDIEAVGFPDPVYGAYRKYYLIYKKSGFVAVSLSAVLPGAGKFYYGQYRPGLNMLIANTVLGIQAYESYRKAGISSARFIVFGGLFSIFYISNLFGTKTGLKKAKADRKKQLHYEITNYHYSDPNYYPGRY